MPPPPPLTAAAAAAGGEGLASSDRAVGTFLAASSALAIGASFIVKKKGLRASAQHSGVRAGAGGYSYLRSPLWWSGLVLMGAGEAFNFAAYAFAPAALVTPLGALSILVTAVMADWLLGERLHPLGMAGCVLCVTGSTVIVLHAPEEREITSVHELAALATAPAFSAYAALACGVAAALAFCGGPRQGRDGREGRGAHSQNVMLVYIAICSLMGSLSVMSCKALGIALKLTFRGQNQLDEPETWLFGMVVVVCIVTQMNYLNKALDLFNTAVVSPIYYVLFTTLTVTASGVMYNELGLMTLTELLTELCAFGTVFVGVALLHLTRDGESVERLLMRKAQLP